MGKEKPVEGKFVTSVKVGPKGQIIVPKEVRDMFNIQPGDMLLMLADVEQGIANLDRLEAQCNLIVPPVGGCDLAMSYTGRAMGDCVPPGTILLLKAGDRDAIIPGEEYVIVCRKIVTLRIVRAAEEEGKVRLVAGDREHYDDIGLNDSDILSVYKVKGKLIINS